MSGRATVVLAVASLVAVVFAIAWLAALARPRAINGANGVVYVETNSPEPDNSNAILAFRYVNGKLDARHVDRYRTRGRGSFDLSNTGVLDSDQEVIINPSRTFLFAVNAGSDTIAAFQIAATGALTPVKGSPFPSNGVAPASLGLSGNTLIVANKAQDGIRLDLPRTRPANYTSFRVKADGSLSKPVSSIDIPPPSRWLGASPLQTYVTPGGKVMISSEEEGSGPLNVGVFRAFRIGTDGRLIEGSNSPVTLDPAVFDDNSLRRNNWPAGLVSHPSRNILYAQVANQNRMVIYTWDQDARLRFVRAMPNPGAVLPCWTEVNAAGTRLYSGNAGSGNITVFDISQDPLHPGQMQSIHLDGVGNPWNFALDPSGRELFIVNMRADARHVPSDEGNTLHALRIGSDGRLAELSSSPVKIPVPVNTNPYGIAVLPTR
jgi:6-phosphogluconolactonase (cycloisomerase 2 family)